VQNVVPLEVESVQGDNGRAELQPKSALAIVIGKYFTPKHVEIHKHGIEPDIWYNFQNQLQDDPKLKAYETQLKAKQDEMSKIRTEATKYMRASDVVRNEAAEVAAALARGENVPDRPEVKAPEEEHSPLGPAPRPDADNDEDDKAEPQQSDSAPAPGTEGSK
jgi:C-terminal processing protease CtpA/Prc